MTNPAGTGFKGKLNIYVCEKCKGHIVTKDIDEGTTPFMVGCKATLNCDGKMLSSFYRVYDQTMRHSYEWYAPSVLEKLTPAEIDHVKHFKLLMRKAA